MRRAIPNLLTIGNLLLGVLAVQMCLQGDFRPAAVVIMVGMALDGLDGRVARMLGTESEFGRELDSLADIVTFGIAPAAVMYMVELRSMGPAGTAIALLYPLAGAFRLARFNVQKGRARYFVGLPITAAGGIMAAFSLYHGLIPGIWLPVVTVALSLLMVSHIRYPNFKRVGWPRAAFAVIPLLAVAVGVLVDRHREAAPRLIFGVLILYGASGAWLQGRSLLLRRRKRREALSESRD